MSVEEQCDTRRDRSVPAAGEPFDPLADDDTGLPWCRHLSEVDMDKPSVARVYDAYLDGAANNQADRDFAGRVREIIPNVHQLAVANRRFLARGVAYAMQNGVDQIIDIGCGVPSIWHTHYVAHQLNATCRVAYVDHEAVAYQAMLEVTQDDDRLGVVRADLRDVEAVLGDPVTTQLVDFSKPVALVMGLLLHFIPDDDDPAGLLIRYRQAIEPDSYVIISHDTADGREADMARLAALYADMGRPLVLRNHAELAALVNGFELVQPGIVHMPLWHPTEDDPVIDPPESSCVYAAVVKA